MILSHFRYLSKGLSEYTFNRDKMIPGFLNFTLTVVKNENNIYLFLISGHLRLGSPGDVSPVVRDSDIHD